MSKYAPLGKWLRQQPQNSVTLTFAQIEGIIGDYLPSNTREYFRGWDKTPGSALNDAFLNAGWKTVMVDMENEKVKFQRIQGV